MERKFWNKLRILVTNQCNYRCPFCHNEGQGKSARTQMMDFAKFQTFVDYLNGQEISELHFSGGEPFLNKDIVRMIQYVNDNTSWGIGCATNLSRITETQISELARTRIKFNIQFPYANSLLFNTSTGNGDFAHIIRQLKLVRLANIPVGLNAVVQNENIQNIEELLLFAIENKVALKLLPQIGLNNSCAFKEQIYPLLERFAIKYIDKGTGATRWTVQINGKATTVLYIDSPCFTKDISTCRMFGELRIHPDFKVQPCIMKREQACIDLSKGKREVIKELSLLWNNFKKC
jgi:cyclic pyranopterin phosphate synthase